MTPSRTLVGALVAALAVTLVAGASATAATKHRLAATKKGSIPRLERRTGAERDSSAMGEEERALR